MKSSIILPSFLHYIVRFTGLKEQTSVPEPVKLPTRFAANKPERSDGADTRSSSSSVSESSSVFPGRGLGGYQSDHHAGASNGSVDSLELLYYFPNGNRAPASSSRHHLRLVAGVAASMARYGEETTKACVNECLGGGQRSRRDGYLPIDWNSEVLLHGAS
ncbi:hypothetical protein CMUS01_01594 [Colletotrichum musicola]|uniref:Uncharacterized protein n=1 Tax=Colletotrichum musicola TaxID=2175873 RepID=A0A8H6U7X2_9PEZI|nr:hypothetical protein CMUS01_01594 [Colletotrichum musicola]